MSDIEEINVVAWMNINSGMVTTSPSTVDEGESVGSYFEELMTVAQCNRIVEDLLQQLARYEDDYGDALLELLHRDH